MTYCQRREVPLSIFFRAAWKVEFVLAVENGETDVVDRLAGGEYLEAWRRNFGNCVGAGVVLVSNLRVHGSWFQDEDQNHLGDLKWEVKDRNYSL